MEDLKNLEPSETEVTPETSILKQNITLSLPLPSGTVPTIDRIEGILKIEYSFDEEESNQHLVVSIDDKYKVKAFSDVEQFLNNVVEAIYRLATINSGVYVTDEDPSIDSRVSTRNTRISKVFYDPIDMALKQKAVNKAAIAEEAASIAFGRIISTTKAWDADMNQVSYKRVIRLLTDTFSEQIHVSWLTYYRRFQKQPDILYAYLQKLDNEYYRFPLDVALTTKGLVGSIFYHDGQQEAFRYLIAHSPHVRRWLYDYNKAIISNTTAISLRDDELLFSSVLQTLNVNPRVSSYLNSFANRLISNKMQVFTTMLAMTAAGEIATLDWDPIEIESLDLLALLDAFAMLLFVPYRLYNVESWRRVLNYIGYHVLGFYVSRSDFSSVCTIAKTSMPNMMKTAACGGVFPAEVYANSDSIPWITTTKTSTPTSFDYGLYFNTEFSMEGDNNFNHIDEMIKKVLTSTFITEKEVKGDTKKVIAAMLILMKDMRTIYNDTIENLNVLCRLITSRPLTFPIVNPGQRFDRPVIESLKIGSWVSFLLSLQSDLLVPPAPDYDQIIKEMGICMSLNEDLGNLSTLLLTYVAVRDNHNYGIDYKYLTDSRLMTMILKQTPLSSPFLNLIKDQPYFKGLVKTLIGLKSIKPSPGSKSTKDRGRFPYDAINRAIGIIETNPEHFGFSPGFMIEPRDNVVGIGHPLFRWDNQLKFSDSYTSKAANQFRIETLSGAYDLAFTDKLFITCPCPLGMSQNPKYPNESEIIERIKKGLGPTFYHTVRKRYEIIVDDPIFYSRITFASYFPSPLRFATPAKLVKNKRLTGSTLGGSIRNADRIMEFAGTPLMFSIADYEAHKVIGSVPMAKPEVLKEVRRIGSSLKL